MEPAAFDAWYVRFNELLGILVKAVLRQGAEPKDRTRIDAAARAWGDLREHARKRGA